MFNYNKHYYPFTKNIKIYKRFFSPFFNVKDTVLQYNIVHQRKFAVTLFPKWVKTLFKILKTYLVISFKPRLLFLHFHTYQKELRM